MTDEQRIDYRGFIVSWPRLREAGAGWDVALTTNNWALLQRLGGRARAFSDPHSLTGAIAMAKRYVDVVRG